LDDEFVHFQGTVCDGLRFAVGAAVATFFVAAIDSNGTRDTHFLLDC
jgi:hypothetical protein